MVKPIISGTIIDRRDQVFIGRLLLVATACSTFLVKWVSTNGPFLIERGKLLSSGDYFLKRLRTISLSVRLLVRVLWPLVGTPHGVTGCRPPEVRPSPPP